MLAQLDYDDVTTQLAQIEMADDTDDQDDGKLPRDFFRGIP